MEERIKQLETTVANLTKIVEMFIDHIGYDGELHYFDHKEKETLRHLNIDLNVIKEDS